MSGSVGMNESKNKATSSQDVWGPQGDAFQGLYDYMGGMLGDQSQFQNQYNDQAGRLTPGMEDLFNQGSDSANYMQGGGSIGDTTDIRNQLMQSLNQSSKGSQMGDMYNSIVGGEGNSYIDPMVDAMKSGAMENNQMMQAGNDMEAASMGQGGSSRHAMQNAMTNKATNQQMLDQETNMRGGAYDKDLAMKMGIAQQADQGVQNSQQSLMNMLGMADQNRSTGMGMAQGAQDLGMGSMNPWMQAQQNSWSPAQMYGNILGDPTVLSQGEQKGSSWGHNASGGVK